MEFRLSTITPYTTLVVSVDDARAHLRIDSDDTSENALIEGFVRAATAHAENYLNRALLTTVFEQKFDSWNNNELMLFRTPVIAITSVKYYDTDGTEQTMNTDLYEFDTSVEPSVLLPKYEQEWPALRGHRNDVVVRYTAGYGTAATNVPKPIIQAILLMLTSMYEHRDDRVFKMPTASMNLLQPYRVLWL